MSPDTPKSETTTGSEKFVDGHHPTDGVRPFKQGDLSEVENRLLERGVPEIHTIDPHTLDVPVEKFDLNTPEKQPGWRKWVAGLVGGAVLAGGGYGAAKLGDGEATSPQTIPEAPVASAPATPGEATPTPLEEAEQASAPENSAPEKQNSVVGEANVTLEGANVKVPNELAEQAASPILSSEYSPREAAELWTQYLNIYLLSATIDPERFDGTQLPESVVQGNAILENLNGTVIDRSENGVDTSDLEKLRANIANTLHMVNDMGGGKPGSTATYHREYTILGEEPALEGSYTFDTKITVDSNFAEIYPELWVIPPHQEGHQTLTLKEVDGRYICTNLTTVE
jgi:hypothetical protein